MNTSKSDLTKEFYDRVYLCQQGPFGKYECIRFNSLESAKLHKRQEGTYLSTGPLDDTNANVILPVHKSITTVFPMCKYTPEFVDGVMLRWKLFKLDDIKISRE